MQFIFHLIQGRWILFAFLFPLFTRHMNPFLFFQEKLYLLLHVHRWLDKLAIAAVVGHKRVFRQTFVGGNYALLDENQNPLPVYNVLVVKGRSILVSYPCPLAPLDSQDYWLSVLYKKLVGTRVLYVLGSLEYGRYLRAYAHCAKPP